MEITDETISYELNKAKLALICKMAGSLESDLLALTCNPTDYQNLVKTLQMMQISLIKLEFLNSKAYRK